MERNRFTVGQGVKWTSQSQGYTREKRGMITEVVPAGVKPDTSRSGLPTPGSSRDHESYIVRVLVGKTKRAKPRYYWPHVSKLEAIPATELPRVVD